MVFVAIRNSFLFWGRKGCAGVHPEGFAKGFGFSACRTEGRSVCALFFELRSAIRSSAAGSEEVFVGAFDDKVGDDVDDAGVAGLSAGLF